MEPVWELHIRGFSGQTVCGELNECSTALPTCRFAADVIGIEV